jgi:hypothetical protein
MDLGAGLPPVTAVGALIGFEEGIGRGHRRDRAGRRLFSLA